jgi:hypothetical protein
MTKRLEVVKITEAVDVRRPLSRIEVIKATRMIATPFAVEDVAAAMGEKEYRVRAAIGWLVHSGRAVPVGERIKISPIGRSYPVALYEMKDEKVPGDWRMLYAAFGL